MTISFVYDIILASDKEIMRNEAIVNLLKEFKKLSISEREKFIDFISANSSPSDFKFIVDTKLADGIVCPYCGAKGKGVCKNGVHSNGRPRFICNHCDKQFSTTPRRTSPYGKSLFSASCMASLFASPLKSVVSIRTPHSCGDISSVIVLWVS